jgi:hypothetical protein
VALLGTEATEVEFDCDVLRPQQLARIFLLPNAPARGEHATARFHSLEKRCQAIFSCNSFHHEAQSLSEEFEFYAGRTRARGLPEAGLAEYFEQSVVFA